MASRRWGPGIASLVVVLVVAVAYRWWASDERAIRNQMSAIAESLTVTTNEGGLGAVTRMARLRKALAQDIRVSPGPPPAADPGVSAPLTEEIVGRDAVLALASRWMPPPGGVTVDFVDVQVKVNDDRINAQVYCTAKITSRGASAQPTVDARELRVGLAKVEGAWLVASVRPEPTLMR